MKILFILDSITAWQTGIWWHRNETPGRALGMRGHKAKHVAIGQSMPKEFMDWCDVVIFGRTYAQVFDPVGLMREFKRAGKRIIYDMDDDYWQVAKNNPSISVSSALKDQYEGMIKEADALITPSKSLAKKFKIFRKPVFLCPNGVDSNIYRERPRAHEGIIIGYMGAASHWEDLAIVVEALEKLYEKHNFSFNIYGMVGEPMEAAMYYYNKMLANHLQPEKDAYFRSALDFYTQLKKVKGMHIPFYPPELHPTIMTRCDFDIGVAPLLDTEFNHGKSCIKFYEYAAVGTVTLASDVEPYKSEVNYRAKNTTKDWHNKLEKLIVDEKFREKILQEQIEYVKKYRSLEAIGLDWELACQRPGGLPVLNQQKE